MCLMVKKVRKKVENKIQNEKIVEKSMDILSCLRKSGANL